MSLNQRYASLNKPRPDYPIYPSTGYYRERAKVFKKPKGRGGKKPKGQRVGNLVKYQDPNYILIKEADEARKARELAIEQVKVQRKELEDAKTERREVRQEKREELAQLRLESDRREQRLIEDRREIAEHLTNLYEAQERRAGENLEIFERAFKAIADRRPVDFVDIKLQEQTDLTADQRRGRRGRSESFERGVSVGLESLASTPKERRRTPSPERERQVKEVLATQPEPERDPLTSSDEGRQSITIETIEQTTQKGRDVKLPKRYEGGATEEELAEAGAIGGSTPASQRYKQKPKPKTTVRGGTGSQSVERQRPKLKSETGVYQPKVKTLKEVRKDNPVGGE